MREKRKRKRDKSQRGQGKDNMLINSKKVKDFLKNKGLRSSADALFAINEELEKICLKTVSNTLAQKIKTIKASQVPKIDPLLSSSSPIKD